MNSFVHLKIDFTCFFRGEGAENRGIVDQYNNQSLQIGHLKAHSIPKYAYLISFLEKVWLNLNENSLKTSCFCCIMTERDQIHTPVYVFQLSSFEN